MIAQQRRFLFVYAIANFGLIAYGLMTLLNPGVLFDSFTGEVYRFPESAIQAVSYLSALFRLLGYFNLLLGAIGLVLLWILRGTSEPRIMWLVMSTSLAGYLGPIVFDNTVGSIGLIEVIEHALFIAMLLVGLFHVRSSSHTKSVEAER